MSFTVTTGDDGQDEPLTAEQVADGLETLLQLAAERV